MKRIQLLSLAALLAISLATPAVAARKATIKIINESKWEIHELYLSPNDDQHWGPDQLGEKVLAKGQSITLTGIECDKYDIRVVDEDGDECVIEGADLCGDATYWKITDKKLLACEGDD